MSGEINRRLKILERELRATELAKVGYPVFIKNTPQRQGNARRNTKLDRDEIEADYPYAGRLEEGYSKQAPRGMVEPTLKAVSRYIQNKGKR